MAWPRDLFDPCASDHYDARNLPRHRIIKFTKKYLFPWTRETYRRDGARFRKTGPMAHSRFFISFIRLAPIWFVRAEFELYGAKGKLLV